MKRRLFLAAAFSIFFLGLNAQTIRTTGSHSPVFFIGHTIRVFQIAKGYGYDISYQNRLLIHQTVNPVTGLPTGLRTEEEAIKLAKWQIIHFRHPGMAPTPEERVIPKETAKQLKIDAN